MSIAVAPPKFERGISSDKTSRGLCAAQFQAGQFHGVIFNGPCCVAMTDLFRQDPETGCRDW